jgi:chaperonin GroES
LYYLAYQLINIDKANKYIVMATKTTTNIKPLFDNVLVKPLKAEEKSIGGIYLPENTKKESQTGEVVAIGDGARDENGKIIPMIIKVGQIVMYAKWGGNEVKVGNEEWKLVKQSDILAIVQ